MCATPDRAAYSPRMPETPGCRPTLHRRAAPPLPGTSPRRCHHGVVGPITVRGAVIPPEELLWRFSRSSGPGGQSVNTTDSRAEVSYDLASSTALGPVLRDRALRALAARLNDGVLTVSASEYRSQLRNREAALSRLAALLTPATAPPPAARRPTKPSRSAVERRLAAKRRRSQVKRWRGGHDDG